MVRSSQKFGFTICLSIIGAFGNYIVGQDLIYDNVVYVDYLKTVKLSNTGNQLSFPTVDLASTSKAILHLKFDDMEGGFKPYTYKIIHCDKDWYPSDLQEIEYMDGFNNEEIENFEYSTNGYSDYTNYNLYLPNDELTWTISGNYLLVITDQDLQVPVITRRFIVSESVINIGHQSIKPRNVRNINTHQEFKLNISYENFDINQPQIELFTTMMQNDNWNSAKTNLVPTYERGQSIILDQYDYISFPALKEFRSFDIRPLSYTTEFVRSIDQDEFETTVLLDSTSIRAQRNSVHELDANGYFIIDNERYRNPEVSSEYCNVIYNLFSNKKFEEDLYIVGAFSDWQAKEEYKMYYDEEIKAYLGQAYFKQGYYNYMFALLDKETGNLDIDKVEGSWYETENDYFIIVYYREFGSLFDRILAVKKFNSNQQLR
ncbi:MAG: DUF5103 domain-containing protein [Saprospiraceae bacterium]|nr:DUF5103 domain-containing protein [Bacteroidia bacterium]NNE14072.1 DUF5103 domain-containing protein [Saprospiraceae bacterium]